MESTISQQFEERRPNIQAIDSPIMGDTMVGMENHIPKFEEHLPNIDARITIFEDRNGREDGIKAVFVLAENDFRKSFYMKSCFWLRMENKFFRKIIYFDRKIAPLTQKIFSASVLPSNHF